MSSQIHPQIEVTKSILKDLIAFQSVSANSNLHIIDYIADVLREVGAHVEVQNHPSEQKANLFATIGPRIDGGIVLSGHSDVVPVEGQPWTHDPFEMVERDGKLYGRGTCDMKGFIACTLAMAKHFAAANLKRPVHFAFTYDEETGCIGAKALADFLKSHELSPRVAIIGEPTEMKVIEGHKGVCEYTTHFQGLAGHGSKPDAGVNAVEYAVRYVGELMSIREALKTRAPSNPRFDPPWTTINIGGLHGGMAHNVIADHAEVEWEFRPVQASDYEFVHEQIQKFTAEELLPKMQAVDANAKITLETIGEVQGLEPAEDNEAKDICCALTGNNHAGTVAFGTEAGIFQSIGMSVVVCGPGSIDEAHKADEFIKISELGRCLDMLEKLTESLSQS